MAVKTITITHQAYQELRGLKMESESFSEGIIRLSQERKGNLSQFLGILKDSKKGLEDMKIRIKKRREEIDKESEERGRKIRERFDDRS